MFVWNEIHREDVSLRTVRANDEVSLSILRIFACCNEVFQMLVGLHGYGTRRVKFRIKCGQVKNAKNVETRETGRRRNRTIEVFHGLCFVLPFFLLLVYSVWAL